VGIRQSLTPLIGLDKVQYFKQLHMTSSVNLLN
jgi:hypothetical protein